MSIVREVALSSRKYEIVVFKVYDANKLNRKVQQ